jgi:hypothetical protein
MDCEAEKWMSAFHSTSFLAGSSLKAFEGDQVWRKRAEVPCSSGHGQLHSDCSPCRLTGVLTSLVFRCALLCECRDCEAESG